MKALVYTAPRQLEYRDVPDPVPSEGEVLVRVEAVGICGSDMHAWLGHDDRRAPPLILGHEAAGVVETGEMAGRRVTINPLVTCGTCEACRKGRDNLCPRRQIISMEPRQGAFAERVRIPAANLVEVPEHVPFEKACLAEPLACGWHAARLAFRHDPDAATSGRCLVIGGGAIGLGAALALHAMGARSIAVAETNPRRHAALRAAGAFDVIDPSCDDRDVMYDIVVDGAGFAATRAIASKRVKPGGIVTHIGLGEGEGGLDIRRLTLQEVSFVGTYTYTPADFRQTAEAIFQGRLGSLDWPDIRKLSDGASAFAEILSGDANAPKIILRPIR